MTRKSDGVNFSIGLQADKLGVSTTINLPKLIQTRCLIAATSGGGKSGTVYELCEALSSHVQIIVIDPEGEYAPLRNKFPFVLAGPQGETPAHPRTAAMLAHRLLELRADAICDLYELKHNERHEFVAEFLQAMVDSPKKLWHPVLVIVDEAHMFAPEKGQGDSVALAAVTDMATRGRKRGFCLVLATQRLAMLQKNVAAMCQNMLIGRTSQIDQNRAADLLHISGKTERLAFMRQITRMETGEFYTYGLAFKYDAPTITKIYKAETLPTRKLNRLVAKIPATPKAVAKLLPKLTDIPKEAEQKAKTEKELRDEIRALKQQVAAAARIKPVVDNTLYAEREVKYKKAAAALTARLNETTTSFAMFSNAVQHTVAVLKPVVLDLERLKEKLDKKKSAPFHVAIPENVSPAVQKAMGRFNAKIAEKAPELRAAQKQYQAENRDTTNGSLSKGERELLVVLAQRGNAVPRSVISALTGFATSTRNEYIRRLNQKGYVQQNSDSSVTITDEGQQNVGSYDELPSGDELVAWWVKRLSKGEAEILRIVHKHGTMNKSELINYTESMATSTRNEYVRRLYQKALLVVAGDSISLSEAFED